ncbi:MAG: type II secretion system protein [Planctomycetes bacterium]|nr:type II secretion system protein [Planctomycetota bacterium]
MIRTASTVRAAGMPHSAFSLIELLVVLVIIAVLAGMLLPALRQVRETARTSQCASNLRQTGLFIDEYSNDNDGRFPGSGQSTGSVSWHNILNMELLVDHGTQIYRYDQWDKSPLRCPNLDRSVPYLRCWAMNYYANGGTYGGVYYGFDVTPPSTRGPQYASWTRYSLGASVARFPKRSKTVLIADSNGDQIYDANGILSGARHGPGRSAANVLFMDGHVETMHKSRLLPDIKYLP